LTAAPQVRPLGPRVLSGRFVALEPLEPHHHAGLIAAAADPDIWHHMPVASASEYAARLPLLAEQMAKGLNITYAIRRLSDGVLVGSSAYYAIVPEHARLEIGWTWYGAGARATAVNPESKYLMLANAFDAHYHRVEFKTDSRNLRSRAALAKLGATEDGTLRGHMWMPRGYFRDSVYFSVLASEWPAIRAGLEARLAAFA
jgi:RimJ/RimL family protein N-acetyltransferase